jgi:phosphoglycerate dehydrogenase-like enzyme
MAVGKVVVLTRGIDPDLWDMFMAEKPAGWQVKVVNPDDGDEKVVKELEDAEYLLPIGALISPKVLETAKQLKLIQSVGRGTDRLPVNWALQKGVAVANAGDFNAIAVAEHTVLLILACLRRFILFNQCARDGKYQPSTGMKGLSQLYDKTVGVVGLGSIGRRVAELCYGFGASIIYFEKLYIPYPLRAKFKARPVSLDELLSTSDIVTLHIPALESNRGMIGWAQLIKMKPSAYLINTSRGTLIDEVALLRALNEKMIAGAGLDVWNPEPPDPNNPLLQMPNVVASPHYAGYATENQRWAYEAIWRNILLVSEGKEPLDRIREF